MSADEVRNSADMAGADFKIKMEKMKREKHELDKKAETGEISEAEKKRKAALANIEVTAHKLTAAELEAQFEKDYNCSGANSIIANGLTSDQVAMGLAKNGPNELTPPKQKPEWLKCIETQKGFFNLLLWAGSILCFISFGIDNSAPDNLYLGIVLAFVVTATGIFEYFQEKSSSDLMKKFANMQPPKVIVLRDGKETKIPAKDLTHVSSSLMIAGAVHRKIRHFHHISCSICIA
jgi:magnesium-transporting ATPase (P-type)